MDKDSETLKSFEEILRNEDSNIYLNLYSAIGNAQQQRSSLNNKISAKDILTSVDDQIKAMQGADCMNRGHDASKNNKMAKKCSFLPVNMLPQCEASSSKTCTESKFETQCVTDTELVNLIQDAEARDAHQGITQEYEASFCDVPEDNNDVRPENPDKMNPDESNNEKLKGSMNIGQDVSNNLNSDNDIVNCDSKDDTDSKLVPDIQLNSGTDCNNAESSRDNKDMEFITCESNIKRPADVEMILDTESVIISNEPLDLDNIPENYEAYSIPLTFESAEDCNKPVDKDANLDDKKSDKCFKIVDISLKEPDTNKLNIRATDLPETDFMENEYVCDDNRESDDAVTDTLQDVEMPSSPIFDVKAVNQRASSPNSPQHIVVDLETFEKFEKVAWEALHKNFDVKTAKSFINSQILGKELFIQRDYEPELNVPDQKTEIKIIEAQENVDHSQNSDGSTKKASKATPEIIKDEILFSSDEEEEFLLNKVEMPSTSQDLPLTCALETSFYEQPDILNKTMYVGFQTASNKSIQVFTDSFQKAQSVFDNIEKQISGKEPSLIEMVENINAAEGMVSANANYDDLPVTLIGDVNKKHNDDSVNDIVEEPIENQLNEDTVPPSQILPTKSVNKSQVTLGFRTASNKNIELMGSAIEKAKHVFKDIVVFETEKMIKDRIENIRNKITSTIISDLDKNPPTPPSDTYTSPENNNKDKSEELKCTNVTGEANSGKESEEILFTDFNLDDISLLKDNVFDDCDFDEQMDIDDDESDNLQGKDLTGTTANNANLELCFKTASNKSIKISDEAFAKTKNVFSNIDSIELPKKQQSKGSNNGHTDNDLKNIKFDENDDNQTFIGFKTASNKKIKITEKGLAKTKSIFNDIDSLEFSSLKTKTEQTLNVDKESTVFKTDYSNCIKDKINTHSATNEETKIELQNHKPTFEVKLAVSVHNEKDAKFSNCNYETKEHEPTLSGFKTASNTKIEISAEALSKTKKLLNDLINAENFDTNNDKGKSGELIVGFQTASSKPVKISEAALVKSRKLFQDIDNDTIMPDKIKNHQGFKTASNKKVNVSDKALIESRRIYHDLNSDKCYLEVLDNKIPSNINSKFYGFKTASDKDIQISEKALAKSKKLFQDLGDKISLSNVQNNVSPKFQRFKTTSCKDINISEQALAKRKLFQELDNQIHIAEPPDKLSPKYKDLQTANKKEVPISKNTWAKSKKLFQDFDIEMDKFNKPDEINTKFKGFKTASHKEVKISEKALARSKKLFEDLDDLTTPTKRQSSGSKFDGFQTAANKKVTMSPKALSRGRRILAELHLKENKKDVAQKQNFGFQTVKISDAALAKSRKLFEDVVIEPENSDKSTLNFKLRIDSKTNNYFDGSEMNKNDNLKEGLNVFGFKTGNNKPIKVSAEALAKSKNLFRDLEQESNSYEDSFVKIKETTHQTKETTDINLENIINTQVLNNFEQTMDSEDFKEKTPVKSKRSGSPILSCPRPKRRKFETPYIQKGKIQRDVNNIEKDGNKEVCTHEIKYKSNDLFNPNYKKAKTITLKQLEKLEQSSTEPKPEIDPYITKFNFNNLLNFEFINERNDLSNKKLTTEDIKKLFLDSVNKKFVPEDWIENHLKLITWKLLSYEIRFPKTMSRVCTVKNVLDQLKYRYDKELYNAERSALRKIMEKDDVASKTLVLCVVDIIQDGGNDDSSKEQTIDLLLTDGWYTVRASTDRMLTRLVSEGEIVVGTKLVTSGAEVLGCEQGVAPWEVRQDTSSIRLKISGNSTRRARWFTRLGYHGNRANNRCYGNDVVPSTLSAVKTEGGRVAKVRVLVTRVYPALYVEKFEDGSTVTRSERLEIQHQIRHETERQGLLEKLYEEVERELSDQDSQDSDPQDSTFIRNHLESGSQIAKLMKRNKDPNEFRSNLTDSQRNLLQEHTIKQREKLLQEIQSRIQDKMSKNGLNVARNVVTLLKVRVVGIEEKKDVVVTRGMLSVWKPNDDQMELVREGAWIEVMNVLPTALRNSEIQLSAGKQSVFFKSKFEESERIKLFTRSLRRTCYPIKELTKNPGMTTDYNEIDCVGIIFLIDPPIAEFDSKKFQFQNVYLADADKNMISVNFWGGLKKYGVELLLERAHIISCANLQKRAGNTRKSIPQYRATEFSYFTKTPKNEDARKLIEELTKKMSNIDKDKFCEDCVNLKNNFSVIKSCGNTDVSPYRFQDVSVSRNKIFLDSPLARKKYEDNFNLSGLDFESTFKHSETQEMSPKLLLRKKQINEKIAKLRMYGDPPPLSPMQILNKSKNAGKPFKSPLLSKPSDTNSKVNVAIEKIGVAPKISVTSVNNKLSETVLENKNDLQEIYCSPVLNRTYVKKNMNPVRLNFSKNVAINENDISDVVDQFGEDFDDSPPLSLD